MATFEWRSLSEVKDTFETYLVQIIDIFVRLGSKNNRLLIDISALSTGMKFQGRFQLMQLTAASVSVYEQETP